MTRHSFHQICQIIVFEESCRSLNGFGKVLIGNTLLCVLRASVEEIRVHSQIDAYFMFFFFSSYREPDVMFVLLLILVSITDGN